MEKYKIPFTIEVYNRDVKNKNIAKVVNRGGEIRKIYDIIDGYVDYPVIAVSSKQDIYYDKNGRYSLFAVDHIEDLFIEYEDIPKGTPVIFKYSTSSTWRVGHYHAENLVSIPVIPDYIIMSAAEIIAVDEFDFINFCKLK